MTSDHMKRLTHCRLDPKEHKAKMLHWERAGCPSPTDGRMKMEKLRRVGIGR
jgi:hypothetical protein